MPKSCWLLPALVLWTGHWLASTLAQEVFSIGDESAVGSTATLPSCSAAHNPFLKIDESRVPSGPRHLVAEELSGNILDRQWEADWTRQIVIEELYKIPVVTKRLRSRTRTKWEGFDPAAYRCLQGHCLYACLHYSRTRVVPTKMDIVKLRRKIAYAWKQRPEELTAQAIEEGLSAKDYLRVYIYNGWGGLPEVRLMDQVYPGMNVKIKDLNGTLLWVSATANGRADTWRYTGTHYYVEHAGDHGHGASHSKGVTGTARGGMWQQERQPIDMNGEQVTAIEYVECAYCLACKCWMGPGHLESQEHIGIVQQMFALGEDIASRVLEARRHSFYVQHQPEMEEVIDQTAYVQVGRRRFCLGCMKWAERLHDDSPEHRRFLEQLHQWDQETKDTFLARRAQRSLEVMTDPPSRGGMPVVLRSRSEMRISKSPTRTRLTLRSRSPAKQETKDKELTHRSLYVPPSSRRLPEHVILHRKHPYCLLCGKWDDKPQS